MSERRKTRIESREPEPMGTNYDQAVRAKEARNKRTEQCVDFVVKITTEWTRRNLSSSFRCLGNRLVSGNDLTEAGYSIFVIRSATAPVAKSGVGSCGRGLLASFGHMARFFPVFGKQHPARPRSSRSEASQLLASRGRSSRSQSAL